ncbi:MAG TPA: TadE family protein [Gemmatimonadales bacterium]|nr:TadE family protein [Gemmatimonadales bacterium]
MEFALAVVPFLTLVFGVIEFGWAVYSYNTINSAANEGARRGMVLNRPLPSNPTGHPYAEVGNSDGSYTNPSCDFSTIVGTVGCTLGVLPRARVEVIVDVPPFQPGQSVPPYNNVSVEVRYAYQPIVVFPISGAFTMTGKAVTQTQ